MKRIHILSMAFATTALLAACGSNNEATKDENKTLTDDTSEIELIEQQMKAVDIVIGKIDQKNLIQTIKAAGVINADPQSRAEVTPLTGGMVKNICVNEGDNVHQGQPVAWIENTDIIDLQKSYLTAVKELQTAKQELKRQQSLTAQGAGVNKNLQQAQNASSIAQATATGLAWQLTQLSISTSSVAKGNFATRIPIKAPIGGTVGKISVSMGSHVDVSSVLMDIVNDSRVHCDVMIYEKDIDRIKKGQNVDITLINRPDGHISGTVASINSSFVNDAKAIKVHVRITDRGGIKLLPGASVNALINLNAQKVDALPDDAIVDVGGKKYIFVQTGVKNGNNAHLFKQVEVAVGASELGYTHIIPIEPIEKGAIVVKKNAFYILSMIEGGEDED